MSDLDDVTTRLPNRRTVIGAAAWSVPVIAVMTATPAFAASSPLLDVVTFSTLQLWNAHAEGQPGPIGLNLQLGYYPSSSQYPGTLTFSWTLIVSGPLGTRTVLSGSDSMSRYSTWQRNDVYYPDRITHLPSGRYTFTFTVTVPDNGSRSSASTITI